MMSKDDLIKCIHEMVQRYPQIRCDYVYVSTDLLSHLMQEQMQNFNYSDSLSYAWGFRDLALATNLGYFYLRSDQHLSVNDFYLVDRSGNDRYSYQDHYLNEIVEQALLRGSDE